jgi:hypothetical protein
MRIARGLKQSYKNAREMTVEEVKSELTLRTDCYEVLNDGLNRVYLDIDGSAPSSATPEEFEALRTETLEKIDEIAGDRTIAVMESSRFESRKISFRVVFPTKSATKKDSKAIAAHVAKEVQMPAGVRIDLGPTGRTRRCGCWGRTRMARTDLLFSSVAP